MFDFPFHFFYNKNCGEIFRKNRKFFFKLHHFVNFAKLKNPPIHQNYNFLLQKNTFVLQIKNAYGPTQHRKIAETQEYYTARLQRCTMLLQRCRKITATLKCPPLERLQCNIIAMLRCNEYTIMHRCFTKIYILLFSKALYSVLLLYLKHVTNMKVVLL
jgi:hypothetical protein